MGKRVPRSSELDSAVQEIVAFRDEREWGQFHTPRNLAAAIAIEAAELQELLLWKSDHETASLLGTPSGLRDAAREVADILIFTLLFCNELRIDPIDAIRSKLIENGRKYPTAAARGNALKYTQLRPKKNDQLDAQFVLDLFAPSPGMNGAHSSGEVSGEVSPSV